MANVFFVSHPYNPPTNVKGNICRWNTGREHWRKLLRSQGARYITGLGASPDEGNIVFVGEWECCSECAPCPTNDTRLGYLHDVFLTEMDSWPHILSTDPFVFGPKFYYSCCKIHKTAKMHPGDIILFGSYKDCLPGQMLLDTVMVLEEKIPLLEQPEHRFPYGYSHVTLTKVHPDSFVWEGRMYDDTPDGTFSFVPCLPFPSDGTTMQVNMPCVIDSTICGIPIKVGQNVGITELASVDSKTIFADIASKVTAKGYSLGVRMPMPESKPICDILK